MSGTEVPEKLRLFSPKKVFVQTIPKKTRESFGANIFFDILQSRQMVFLGGLEKTQEKVKELAGRKYCPSSVAFLCKKAGRSDDKGEDKEEMTIRKKKGKWFNDEKEGMMTEMKKK